MEIFYHFSHFFEILTGIYFGGFALLGFIHRSASTTAIYTRIKDRRNDSLTAQVSLVEFFRLRIQSKFELTFKYVFNAFIALIFYSIIVIFVKVFNFFFSYSNKQIEKVGNYEEEIIFKKFFPSFFFAGCFCLVLILFSAFLQDCDDPKCRQAINYFIVYYLAAAFIFHIWALVIFPHFVFKLDYLHLNLINLGICFILIIFVLNFSMQPLLRWDFAWILDKKNNAWLKLITLFVALLPLLYILTKLIFVIVVWELSILFNKLIFKVFNSSKNDLEDSLKKLNDNSIGD